jgi:hypothetical protein
MTEALALLLIGVGLVVWMLPVSECSQCVHCSAERVLSAERRRLGAYCFEHKGIRSACDEKEHKR